MRPTYQCDYVCVKCACTKFQSQLCDAADLPQLALIWSRLQVSIATLRCGRPTFVSRSRPVRPSQAFQSQLCDAADLPPGTPYNYLRTTSVSIATLRCGRPTQSIYRFS